MAVGLPGRRRAAALPLRGPSAVHDGRRRRWREERGEAGGIGRSCQAVRMFPVPPRIPFAPRLRRRSAGRRGRLHARTRATSYGASSSCHAGRRLSEELERSSGIAGRQQQRACGLRGNRREKWTHRARRQSRDSSSDAERAPSSVLSSEHDLDAGAERTCPRAPVADLEEHAADDGVGGVELTLGQPQQREPRVSASVRPGWLAGTTPLRERSPRCRRCSSPCW